MSGNAILVTPSKAEGMSIPEPGLRRQVMCYSPAMMLVRHTMIKGWAFEHPGGVFDAGPGDSFLVPGNVAHQASALEDSEVLDIFTPMREDYAT
jgi:hypothetical protein